jgi:hypothetical protein
LKSACKYQVSGVHHVRLAGPGRDIDGGCNNNGFAAKEAVLAADEARQEPMETERALDEAEANLTNAVYRLLGKEPALPLISREHLPEAAFDTEFFLNTIRLCVEILSSSEARVPDHRAWSPFRLFSMPRCQRA